MIPFVIAGTGLPEVIRLAEDVCDSNSEYLFLGFIDDNKVNSKRNLYGYRILGDFEYIRDNPQVYVVNSISRNCEVRRLSTERLISLGAQFTNLIHPTVLCDSSFVGAGNIVDRQTILHRGSKLGSHNLILSGVVLGHDSQIGDFNFFGHKSIVNGFAQIESRCFIGAGAVIGPAVMIADSVTVGIGCALNFNAAEGRTYFSRPPMMGGGD